MIRYLTIISTQASILLQFCPLTTSQYLSSDFLPHHHPAKYPGPLPIPILGLMNILDSCEIYPQRITRGSRELPQSLVARIGVIAIKQIPRRNETICFLLLVVDFPCRSSRSQ